MSVWQSYRLRLQRKRWRIRAFRKRRELKRIADRTSEIRQDDILVFCTQRNERVRLPYFLDYYRRMGVAHFFFVDNDSDDGSLDYLA
ncbi:glycosyltransferase family 2 protein, partial [Sulfitobacter sp. HI0040]